MGNICFSRIQATGQYLPAKVVRNEDFTQFPANALPLIAAKTGILERRYAQEGECTSDLATCAARQCLAKANFPAHSLDGIILSTSSPDRLQPATATRVQDKLGARRAFAFDVNAVCSGALYALSIGDAMIRSGSCGNMLVIAAEVYSRFLNPRDFSTTPYFGDGAGAVLLMASGSPGILASILHTDGAGADLIQVPGGGSMLPAAKVSRPSDLYFTMHGKEVFEFAVQKGAESISEILQKTGRQLDAVRLIIPHQANENIIRAIAGELGAGYEKFLVNLDRYGNTASASVLIGLNEALESGKLAAGDLGILVAFGGGLCWASMVIQF